MKIILVRHAESEKNIGDKFDKNDDDNDELTANGAVQVVKTAEFLKKIISQSGSTILITGNRKRAIDSTKLLSDYLSCQFEIEHDLLPINPGDLSGISNGEAHKKYPKLMQDRILFSENKISGYSLIFPNGDLLSKYEKTTSDVLNKILINYSKFNNVVIVTHRSVVLAALNIYNKLIGLQDKNIYKYYLTPTGCIVEAEFVSNKATNIIYHGGIEDWVKSLIP